MNPFIMPQSRHLKPFDPVFLSQLPLGVFYTSLATVARLLFYSNSTAVRGKVFFLTSPKWGSTVVSSMFYYSSHDLLSRTVLFIKIHEELLQGAYLPIFLF